MLFSSTFMKIAPIAVPRIVPLPPVALVPPMMTAAMTVIYKPSPELRLTAAETRRHHNTGKRRTDTGDRVRCDTGTPDTDSESLAASIFPPTAYTDRPNVVLDNTICAMTASTN